MNLLGSPNQQLSLPREYKYRSLVGWRFQVKILIQHWRQQQMTSLHHFNIGHWHSGFNLLDDFAHPRPGTIYQHPATNRFDSTSRFDIHFATLMIPLSPKEPRWHH